MINLYRRLRDIPTILHALLGIGVISPWTGRVHQRLDKGVVKQGLEQDGFFTVGVKLDTATVLI
jgi:hypothetical protein